MVALLVVRMAVKMDDLMVDQVVVLKVAYMAARMDKKVVVKLEYLSELEWAAL